MKFSLFLSVFLLFSCNSGDQKICKCLEAGDKLNKVSAQLLAGESSANADELRKLKEDKLAKCKAFENMSGQEMLELKGNCKLDEQTEDQNEEMIEIHKQMKGN